MNGTAAVIAVIAGAVLSGQCATWGARLGGHDPMAGYPFPDFKGGILFLVGMLVVPLGVAAFITTVRRLVSSRLTALPIPIAILLLGPLFSLTMGYSVQARDNRARDREREFHAEQKEAYSHYAAQVTADPGIVLRERWYEDAPEGSSSGAGVSARRMVFVHSFRPEHLDVAYTEGQLREIYERAQDKRLFVVCHPKCPPDLIESMWPLVMDSRQAWLIGRMIGNPATPRHLFEEYQAERLKANRAVSGWIDRAIEERLKKP